VKRIVYSAIAALVALLILAPTVLAQQTTGENTTMMERTMESTQPLPSSGGLRLSSPSVLLPAAALLLSSGILAFAVLRRRR
jgi:hypothetical protein